MNHFLSKRQRVISIISFLMGIAIILTANLITLKQNNIRFHFTDLVTQEYNENSMSEIPTDSQFQTESTIFSDDEVIYSDPIEPVIVDPGNKVVYLTFDDGPSSETERLLDILDKYNVKVTFFVTNQFPSYQYLIKEAYNRGHTVALHTCSHDYSIYTSEETYYKDLQEIHDIYVELTGDTPWLVRFPGGSSNKSSLNYCKGIMTTLTNGLEEHGYVYCDWNVSSGDGGGVTTADAVYNNVIQGIQQHNISIVLQHDNKSFSVDAVERIIQWGLENGYTFLPLTESSPLIQHKNINN